MRIRGMVVAAALLGSTVAVGATVHAAEPRTANGGCFSAGGEEFDRVVVKRKPVRTSSGERVADVRIVAGHYFSNSSGGAEGYGEFWCADLVPARDFVHRNPRITGTVTSYGLQYALGGRGFDGYLSWRGASPAITDGALSVDVTLRGRGLVAHRLVRATFPDLPPID